MMSERTSNVAPPLSGWRIIPGGSHVGCVWNSGDTAMEGSLDDSDHSSSSTKLPQGTGHSSSCLIVSPLCVWIFGLSRFLRTKILAIGKEDLNPIVARALVNLFRPFRVWMVRWPVSPLANDGKGVFNPAVASTGASPRSSAHMICKYRERVV